MGCSDDKKVDSQSAQKTQNEEILEQKANQNIPPKLTSMTKSDGVTKKKSADQKYEFDFDEMDISEIQAKVDELLAVKDWLGARTGLEFLLDDDSEVLGYHFKLGQVFYETSEFARAMNHLNYALETDGEGREEFEKAAQEYDKKAKEKAKELAEKLSKLPDSTAQRADLVFEIMKLDPKLKTEEIKEISLKKRIYYLVSAMENYKERLEAGQNFWNYYRWAYLSYLQKWYADARKAVDKAILYADSHLLIWYALKLQEQIEKVQPSETSSDLDKLSALDLTEDMLDSFLNKYQKDLRPAQIDKAREVIKMGIKLKEKLDKATSDQEKLRVLQEFKSLSKDIIQKEDFPPDIKSKIEKGTVRAEKRLQELEEQIRVKQEALKG